MHEQERLKLIREIERKRGSRVITYITIDRAGLYAPVLFEDVRILEHHLRLCLHGHHKASKIDLFLHTPGGSVYAPWALVSLMREYLRDRQFSVLVPSRVFSAGTSIALGADEIVMGPGGNLGPVDAQLGSFGVEDFRGYFNMGRALGLTSRREQRRMFETLSRQAGSPLLGFIYRIWSESEREALTMLKRRRQPLPDRANRQIANYLLKRIGYHGQSIRRTEAREIGISFVKDAEHYGIDQHMARLFDEYEALLNLDVPVHVTSGDEADPYGDADGVPVALVESSDRLDIAYGEYFRHWRQGDAVPANDDKQAPAHHMGAPPSLGLNWKSLRGAAQS